MSAAQRTPIIGAFPKLFIPFLVVVPGMIAAVSVPELAEFKCTGEGDVDYNDAILLLMRDLLPNGILGVALAGLLASFMAGVAANLSSFNTVFTYDIWQAYVVRDRPDAYYLRMGRWVTVGATVAAVGTAFIASGYSNLMDYLQQLFSIFNAPLFATFIVGMFWKRMTPTAGWLGLVSGMLSAVTVFLLHRGDVLFDLSDQGASFLGAGVAFVVDVLVSVVATRMSRPKAPAELVGLVYSLPPRESLRASVTGQDAGWYRRPGPLAGIALVIVIVLNIVFG